MIGDDLKIWATQLENDAAKVCIDFREYTTRSAEGATQEEQADLAHKVLDDLTENVYELSQLVAQLANWIQVHSHS